MVTLVSVWMFLATWYSFTVGTARGGSLVSTATSAALNFPKRSNTPVHENALRKPQRCISQHDSCEPLKRPFGFHSLAENNARPRLCLGLAPLGGLCTESSRTSSAVVLRGGADNQDKLESSTSLKELMGEFLGTFLIVQIGCGSVASALYHNALSGLGHIALTWGAVVTVTIYLIDGISQAHFNPAVTLAMALWRPWNRASGLQQVVSVILYWTAQLAGASAAGMLNYFLYESSIAKFEQAQGIVRGTQASIESAKAFGEYWSVDRTSTAFLVETFATFMLTFFIFCLTRSKPSDADNNTAAPPEPILPPILVPPLIGAILACLITTLAPLTQAGMNPARDLGPRLITRFVKGGWGEVAMQGWWVYVLAPLVGGPLGGFVADRVVFGSKGEKV